MLFEAHKYQNTFKHYSRTNLFYTIYIEVFCFVSFSAFWEIFRKFYFIRTFRTISILKVVFLFCFYKWKRKCKNQTLHILSPTLFNNVLFRILSSVMSITKWLFLSILDNKKKKKNQRHIIGQGRWTGTRAIGGTWEIIFGTV